MKKLLSIFISILMAACLCCVSACGDRESEGSGGKKNSLTIEVYEAGFGTVWLDDIADNYQAATGTRVKVNKSYMENEIVTKLVNDQSTADIVFFVGSAFEAQDKGLLVDLSDVLEEAAEGETTPIRGKMNANIYNYLANDDGSIYQLPWANTVSSLCYNETTLDEVLGKGNWTLPNTSDEFFDLAERIKTSTKKGYYTFVDATQTGYSTYLFMNWWAQYSGYQAYYDFFSGYYYPDGVRTFAQNGEIYDDLGRLESLKACEKLLKKANGYTHVRSDSMSFTEAQVAFVGQGYNSDKSKPAFIMSGDWLENEVSGYLQAAEAAGNPQTIKMMKMPVLSSIVKTFENEVSDATLSAAVEAVDKGETSYAGISDKDFDKIVAARNMAYSLTYNHPFCIPSNSRRQEQAKDFIKYMLSDYGQSIYAKNLNGLTMPFGYQSDSANISVFVKSRFDSYGNTYLPIANDYSAALFRRGGIGITKTDSAYIDGDLFAGKSGQKIFDDSSTFYKKNWQEYLKGAGLAKSE